MPPKTNDKSVTPSEQLLVKTLTDEIFQPMRLYYTVHHKRKLESCFNNLACMIYTSSVDDWVVEYSVEENQPALSIPPQDVPMEAQPLIIATIYIENQLTMLIDVRSIERARWIIEFIDNKVPSRIAEITHGAIYNQAHNSAKG